MDGVAIGLRRRFGPLQSEWVAPSGPLSYTHSYSGAGCSFCAGGVDRGPPAAWTAEAGGGGQRQDPLGLYIGHASSFQTISQNIHS